MFLEKMKLQELLQGQKEAFNKADAVVAAVEKAGRDFTSAEKTEYEGHMASARAFTPVIHKKQVQNTISQMMDGKGALIIDGGRRAELPNERMFSEDYRAAFYDYVSSNGQKQSAALYEGSGSAGGFTVPVTVEGQVVPLAPTDMGVRAIASVIPTAMDLKIPRATTISTAAGKAEGTGSGANVFTESEPVLDQFTLSAFMAGVLHQISWELAQDVPSFQSFAVGDNAVGSATL